MEELSLRDLRQRAGQEAVEACARIQLEALHTRETKQGKPFLELVCNDGQERITLRLWSDDRVFGRAEQLTPGVFLELRAVWTVREPYGLEASRLDFRPLSDEEAAVLLAGGSALRAKQEADYREIAACVEAMEDPRLRGVCQRFLAGFGERFQRTAAAREFHHARRGGLVEHVAQMMRSARALAGVYPGVHRDLLLAGVLFHDCGKLWENSCERDGFAMPYQETGELLGHISLGIELINRLWRDQQASPEGAAWEGLRPPDDEVRLHLLHLVASHHGSLEFGSPVLPKTPEAMLLHFIDNIDAKMEMFAEGYAKGQKLAPRVFQRVRPLPNNLVVPLEPYGGPPAEISGEPTTGSAPEEG